MKLVQRLGVVVQNLAAAAACAEEVRKLFFPEKLAQRIDFQFVCHLI